MSLIVREILKHELDIPINYFHESTLEFLQILGVDPAKLPTREQWLAYNQTEFQKPYEQRDNVLVVWLSNGTPIGFSTADTIDFGNTAKMHLHILRANDRQKGFGAECVRRSAAIFFDVLKLDRLYCEPNAYNISPNRTLQKAGFKYLKTHDTTPGNLNHPQAATLWVMERHQL